MLYIVVLPLVTVTGHAGSRLQCNQAIAKSYQQLQSHASTLEQLHMVYNFGKQFEAEAYTQQQRTVKQLRQDIVLLR